MGRQGRGRPPHPDVLTPREWQVLALLREGLTNEQIAGRLDVTVYAAKYHVSEILSKLGVASRDEAALWQPEREPVRQRVLNAGLLVKAAGAALVLATAVGLGVLAWGVLETSGGDSIDGVVRPPATTAAAPTMRPGVAARQLAYAGADGTIWLVNADGTGRTRLAENACGSPLGVSLGNDSWSPKGDKFALICLSPEGYDGSLNVYDVSGEFIGGAKGPTTFRWSPDGQQVAFPIRLPPTRQKRRCTPSGCSTWPPRKTSW